jgi:alkylation response protein AidB-like acyl-CoA dehydrogenase
MTITTAAPDSATRAAAVFKQVRRLRPRIAARADEVEQTRAVPSDLLGELVEAGAFRLSVPTRYGGAALPLPDLVRVLIELARGDGSVGWLAMIASGAPLVLSRLTPDNFDLVYGSSPDVGVRGAIAPKGTARTVPGGYRVTGRWPFMSGRADTRWYVVNCVVTREDGTPNTGPEGAPELRMALLPAHDVELLDTWHGIGLRGTASHDAAVTDRFVAQDRTAAIFDARPRLDEPDMRTPLRTAFAPRVAAVAVGIALGAFDELTALAATKRPALRPGDRLVHDPVYQHHLGEAYLRIAAAEALLMRDTVALWRAQTRSADGVTDPFDIVRPRAMAGFVVSECATAIDALYTMAGGPAVFDSCPMQRRLRDIHALTQHVVATTEHYRPLGSLLSNEPVAAAVLR